MRITFNRLMVIILLVLIPLELVLTWLVDIKGLTQLLNAWPGMLFLLASLYYCRRRKLVKLIEPCQLAIWSTLLAKVLSLLVQIAGRSRRPMVDIILSRLDGQLYFNTFSVERFVERIPVIHTALGVTYYLLPFFMVTAVMLPSIYGHSKASQRYIVGVLLAIVPTVILFALWPAAGPWTSEGFAATKNQAAVTAYLTLLKVKGPVLLNMEAAGIISFPSFHVVLAILSATALSSIRILRFPAWALASLMCVATITTGWHYGVDVIGGMIVAGASVIGAHAVIPHRYAPILCTDSSVLDTVEIS